MAFTNPISNSYIETFERNVRQLAQQSDSRLRRWVTERAEQSEKHNWDRLASSAAVEKTAPRVATPVGGGGSVLADDNLEWTRRVSIASTWHTGEIFEAEDPVQMLIDPESAISVNLAMNLRRAIDDIIISAATGASTDGDGGAVAYPATGQHVGDYTGEITLDTILEVGEIFHANDVDPDEEKVWILGPKQWRKLLQLLEITSGDFMMGYPLHTGVLPNTAGFTFVHSNRLLAGTQAGEINNLAFTRKALGLHVPQDIKVKVAERADLSFSWQVYGVWTMGCTRVEDEHIVDIRLADTIT